MADEYYVRHCGVGKKLRRATVIAVNLSLKMKLNDLEKSN
jgi:hypothetical protein